jgi:hypothetical protein
MFKTFAVVVLLSFAILCNGQNMRDADLSDLYAFFSFIAITDQGMTLTFKDSGPRYIFTIGGGQECKSEYRQDISVPFGTPLTLKGREQSLTLTPLDRRKGFMLEHKADARSSRGKLESARAALLLASEVPLNSAARRTAVNGLVCIPVRELDNLAPIR